MDFELPEDIKMMKQQMRRFVDEEMIPVELESLDGPGVKPEILARWENKMKALGFWHISTPVEYGGLGLGLLARVVLWEELGRTMGLPPRHPPIFGPDISPILFQLSDEMKRKYLYPTIAGEKLECFALTEPEAGSDPARIKTTAVRDGDHYVINGYKRFISWASRAHFTQLTAKTDKGGGAYGMSTFIVDMDAPGVKIIRAQKTMMGDEPYEIAFDNVRVPVEHRVGSEGDGFRLSQSYINVGRLRHAARGIGVITRCLELGTKYAKERVTFGQPLADRQAIQWALVDSYAELRQLRLVAYEAATKYDRGEDIRQEAYLGKILGDRYSFQAADRCFQIFGGIGLTKDLPIEKFWRDQRSMMITEGPEEVMKMAIARHVLKTFS